jgi:NADP-dependent 3-hydroxy acid dehydrogenase YdfG
MKHLPGDPNDVARAVLFAVTQPIEVNTADMVVRRPKSMAIPH